MHRCETPVERLPVDATTRTALAAASAARPGQFGALSRIAAGLCRHARRHAAGRNYVERRRDRADGNEPRLGLGWLEQELKRQGHHGDRRGRRVNVCVAVIQKRPRRQLTQDRAAYPGGGACV